MTQATEQTRLAVPCTACGSWLVAAESVARHMGPVCAARCRPRNDPAMALFELPEGVR